MLQVIFRTCDKVNSIHGLPRPFGLSKIDTIKICFKSLLASIPEHRLTIIGDDLSDETMAFFKEYNAQIINEKLGNDGSLRKMFELAKDFNDEDIVYFVEDDYLHFCYCFSFCLDWLKPGMAIHPTDYPAAYTVERLVPSYILLGKANHWRSINTSTFTFITHAKTVKDNYEHLIASCEGANDAKLSELFGYNGARVRIPLMSPIPGLATHMHEGTMSPFINWEEEARRYK